MGLTRMRIVLIPEPHVRAQNAGRIRDIFIFLLLWYAVRFAVDAAVHRVALTLLPPEMASIRFHLAYTTRSLIGLIFSIWYFKRFCRQRNVSFSERLGIDQPTDFTNPAFLKSLFLFLAIFAIPNIGNYVYLIWSSGFRGDGASVISHVFTGVRVVVLSPLVEELIWRGFAYPICKEAYGLSKGIVITSVLFSLPHLPTITRYPFLSASFAMAYFFFVGVALNIIFERGANLKWCILSHALLNLISFAVGITFQQLLRA